MEKPEQLEKPFGLQWVEIYSAGCNLAQSSSYAPRRVDAPIRASTHLYYFRVSAKKAPVASTALYRAGKLASISVNTLKV